MAWEVENQPSSHSDSHDLPLRFWYPDETRPFRVEADSSDFATGAVLSQQSPEDDKWHPVAYYSKSLSVVEQNYEIHDKEMLQSSELWRTGTIFGGCSP